MALIPVVIGEILAIDQPTSVESLNGYYAHKVTLRVTGIGSFSDRHAQVGKDIAVFVPRGELGGEGDTPFPFTAGQRVSAIVFRILGGWEAEGFRLIDGEAAP